MLNLTIDQLGAWGAVITGAVVMIVMIVAFVRKPKD